MMSNNNMKVLRFFIVTILPFMLFACSYTQNTENVEKFLNYSSLAEVNKQGNYTASLYKQSQFNGTAVAVGQFCSAHKYPYDFDGLFDEAVSSVLDKVYETVELEMASDEMLSRKDVSIDVKPFEILLMCHPVTEYYWECVATTRLSALVVKADDTKINIKVEARKASSAGGVCGGGAVAVSSAIGQTISDFSGQLHNFLITD
ncbi:MAG: hypothetical protein JKY84_09120 [Emcibacteraceae bacterium]|nr:hypothetical protein [Emcibacteraceae bacterium]